MPRDPGKQRHALADLLWLLPLAAAVRVLYLVQLSATPLARHLLVDEEGYHLWARAVAAGQLLAPGPFYQAPLYPYLLGAWYALFGESHLTVRIVHALLGLLSVGLLYIIGSRVFGRNAGRVAGLGAALYLPFVFYEGQILKSSLALAVTLLFVLLLLRAGDGSRGAPWFQAGLGLGVLVLLRGNAFLYVPFLAAWQLGRKPAGEARRPWRRRGWHLGLLIAGMLLTASPATLHNLATGGELILTTFQGGTNFYIGNHPGALGVYMPLRQGRETPAFEGRDAIDEASRRSGRQLSPAEVSRFWFAEGLRFAREHPLEFVRLQGVKLLLTWHAREVPDVWDFEFVAQRVAPLGWPLPRFGWVAPLAILGIAFAYPWRRGAGLLLLMTLATTLSISVFYVFARYRLPLAPLALLFAGHAVASCADALRRRRWRPLALAAVALVPLLLVVHIDLGRFGLVFTDEVGHQNMGFLQVRDGRPDLAEAEFRKAIDINPDVTNAWLMLTQLQAGRDDPEAEEGSLVALLRHVERRRAQGASIIDPVAEASARQRLGRLWRGALRFDDAARQFRLAADLVGNQTVALIELGITLRLSGNLPGAGSAYREALRRDPGNPLALYNLANVELESGDPHAAAARLEEALESCAARQPGLCDDIRSRLRVLNG